MVCTEWLGMQKKFLVTVTALLVLVAVILTAGCTGTTDPAAGPTVNIVEISAAQQLNSLALGQIDGMINWQPNVAAAAVSGVAKVVSYSQNLPRSDGKTWSEHTCCVFGGNKQGLANKDLATVLTGLMLLGNEYITAHPDDSAAAVSNWMYGTTDPVYGSVTVKGVDIIKASLPTIRFSTELTQAWKDSNYEFVTIQRGLNTLTNNLKSTSREDTEALIYDFEPYYAAQKIIAENGQFPEPVSSSIKIGYLLSDHDSPLFILLKNWEFFRDNYNAYLKPVADGNGAVDAAALYVNGKKICDVTIIQGSGGPNLMTLLQTNEIQYAVAGTPPFLSSIDTQPGLKIISPIMTEGSALMVGTSAPVSNWNEFVDWAKQRSAEGHNLLIAVPQFNSIQDVQLKDALESAGLVYAKMSA